MLREGVKGIMDRIRPNIILAMMLSAGLGGLVSLIGWRMASEPIITGAGTATIVVMSNLAMKILEKD